MKDLLENYKDNSDQEGFVTLPLLTVAESAKYLGVGRKIVYQLIEWNQLRVVKNKGAILIEKASLDDYRKSGILT